MGLYKEGNTFKTILEKVAKDRIEHIGIDRYTKDYSPEVDNELDDLVQYGNLSRVTYPLYKILSQIQYEPFELMPNGRPTYSIIMFLAGLTEYDRVADNKLIGSVYKSWAFKHISRPGKDILQLGLEFSVTGSFMEKLKTVVGNLEKDSKGKDIFGMLGDKPVFKEIEGEYWLGKDVVFRKDRELDFLKQLQEQSGLPVSALGLPDNFDIVIPSGFEIPREEESIPVKNIFREDAYEMIKNLYPLVQAEDIFNLVEHFRLRRPLDGGFVKRLKIAGVDENLLGELKEIKYFPSRLTMVGRYILAWRLDQYRKKVPFLYYKNRRAMLWDSRA